MRGSSDNVMLRPFTVSVTLAFASLDLVDGGVSTSAGAACVADSVSGTRGGVRGMMRVVFD